MPKKSRSVRIRQKKSLNLLLHSAGISVKNDKILFPARVCRLETMQSDSQTRNLKNKKTIGLPPKQGLYDPQFEHDACGVGFVVNVKGKKSHDIISQALTVLLNLDHRGACGCEVNTGDGAGILIQMPHAFLQKVCAAKKIELPAEGQYGAGIVFLPPDPAERKECEQIFGKIVAEEGQHVIGWRDLPTNNSTLGETARSS